MIKKLAMPPVLLLDDNQEYRQTMAMMVRHAGYRVIQSDKSAAALDKTRTDPPALIMMELDAGSATDVGFTTQLQRDQLTSGVPIVFYAKEETKSGINKAVFNEAVEVLTKPISAAAVGQALSKHLRDAPNRPRPIASPSFTSSK